MKPANIARRSNRRLQLNVSETIAATVMESRRVIANAQPVVQPERDKLPVENADILNHSSRGVRHESEKAAISPSCCVCTLGSQRVYTR